MSVRDQELRRADLSNALRNKETLVNHGHLCMQKGTLHWQYLRKMCLAWLCDSLHPSRMVVMWQERETSNRWKLGTELQRKLGKKSKVPKQYVRLVDPERLSAELTLTQYKLRGVYTYATFIGFSLSLVLYLNHPGFICTSQNPFKCKRCVATFIPSVYFMARREKEMSLPPCSEDCWPPTHRQNKRTPQLVTREPSRQSGYEFVPDHSS